ncbi:MAG: NAD(P)-binding protein [Caldithrix sp.]|nr:NAD(P)-binding protein [Caldithrix sp.]
MMLTDAQLREEVEKCLYCETKPCQQACPADCSPADFIMAIKVGEPQDYRRSAAEILHKNPLGGICGQVCPDYHCMQACVYETFNHPVNIPAVQAAVIQKARDVDLQPEFRPDASPKNQKVAVVGAGPAGLAAAATLSLQGYPVAVMEKETKAGGMCRLIPQDRLHNSMLEDDIRFLTETGAMQIEYERAVDDPQSLLQDGFDAVIVGTGLDRVYRLNIAGEDAADNWYDFLKTGRQSMTGSHVAVIGGGAVALDCASTALSNGAAAVDMICLENPGEMPLDGRERKALFRQNINVITRTRLKAIDEQDGSIQGIHLGRVSLPQGQSFHPARMQDIEGADYYLTGYDRVITAIGAESSLEQKPHSNIFYAGDMKNGPTTVVEAVASGKNAAARTMAYLEQKAVKNVTNDRKSTLPLRGYVQQPASLQSDFFGRIIHAPFLLSAAPPTDGYEAVKNAYEAGWPGAIMKTAFDDLKVHIPSEYMFVLNGQTFANCDNVSDHPLERVCMEIEQLVRAFPDRLTMASTGGPITGDDNADKYVWQSNTRRLENAGVMGIEYSLSCPQGGDGTEGDIAAQNAALTAKIVDWVMGTCDADIPKLFKLTGAVTAIEPILAAIKEVLNRYPDNKAGVTLANTFPSLEFRSGNKEGWEEGIIVGMSGKGVASISNLTLAKASTSGLPISGNGGPMDYKSAAHFLALGAQTVQFCSIVMKYGYGIIDELSSGLSYLMQQRGLSSISQLIGAALPRPITDFEDLPPIHKIPQVYEDWCEQCGNCTRCSYNAVRLNDDRIPQFDAERCVGCSFCVQNCFAGALTMVERDGMRE